MNPIYLDIHIHTSENPNDINLNYDVDLLIKKINDVSCNSDFLISLTDHNTINKDAYLKLLKKTPNVLLGVELHIKNYDDRNPYHCHIIFDNRDVNEEIIDKINVILDKLYPDKVITPETQNVPSIDTIVRNFDKFEFILLPHGGQSHSTFDKSIKGDGELKFDTVLERYIYHNQFDGFTARSNEGLDATINYFKRLGINEFVNLVTCTDNYNPAKYPNTKSNEATEFIPTWMLANPTFKGLRLSLSESSRLIYSKTIPNNWAEYIEKVCIKNEMLDIDVNLTPGLNVVIGGSSSGKTLFIDSIYRSLYNDYEDSNYKGFNIENIEVTNPSGNKPHYFSQNYIIKVIDPKNTQNKISDIDIIKSVFPEDKQMNETVNIGLLKLKRDLSSLINCVESIETEVKKLSHYQLFTRLMMQEGVKQNIFQPLLPTRNAIAKIRYEKTEYDEHIVILNEIKDFLSNNRLAQNSDQEIKTIKGRLANAFEASNFEKEVSSIILAFKKEQDAFLQKENKEHQSKKKTFDDIKSSIQNYTESLNKFHQIMDSIASYSIKYKTQEVKSMGHTLFIENNFELTKEKFVEIANKFLDPNRRIGNYEDIEPKTFFSRNFANSRPVVKDYKDFAFRIYNEFEKLNNKEYRIITSEDRDFYSLSAGWRTAVILDLILGYDGDLAPVLIDQPEDNLATGYINGGLIRAIKDTKIKKQVILVSHNATIPMLGDAQNIILCQNKESKLYLRSAKLEEQIDGKDVVDYIAEITDGGKPSIKKRVKKYNLKQYKG